MLRSLGLAAFLSLPSAQTFAASLECKTIDGAVTAGLSQVEATAPLSDTDYAAGFRVTGGGCVQSPGGGEQYVYTAGTRADERSFRCRMIGSDGTGIRVTANATACRTPPVSVAEQAAFTNWGLGGGNRVRRSAQR